MAYQREETQISERVKVRKVPCFTRPQDNAWYQTRGYEPSRIKSYGVHVWWVMVDGRAVDSFLSAARAKAKAKVLAALAG